LSDADAWRAAGLYDPAAPGAAERLELLDHLSALGLTTDELVAANARGELITAGSDKMLHGERALTAVDVAEETGVPLERVLRIWLAVGLPVDDPDTTVLPEDAPIITSMFLDGAAVFGEEAVLGFSRVMGGAASQVAEAAVALFLGEVQPQLEIDHASELQRALANEGALVSFGGVGDVLARLVREHAIATVSRSRQARGLDPTAPLELEMAVCFVDLVGSTAWGQRLPLAEQATALGRFESAAWEEAVRHGGRLVKLIGDEAMITVPSASDACAITLDVCGRVARDPDLPPARGAVGFGTVFFRAGDYFGPLVNVVARAVKAAEPGEVVVTAPVAALVEERFRAGPLVDHDLRGIDGPVALAPLLTARTS